MNRLKELRQQMGLSQSAVSAELNIAQNTLSQYERGVRNMDSEVLLKLSRFYHVSVDDLLGNTPIKKSAESLDSTDAIQFALFGETGGEIDEEILEDVRNYAKYVLERKRKQGKDNKGG